MFLSNYPERDGKKVWLEPHELDQFINEAEDTEQKICFQLMGYSGLRSAETLAVTPNDVVETGAGPRVYVHEGKGGKDRETIASDELVSLTRAYTDVGDRDPDTPMIATEYTRTVRKWTTRAAGRLAERTGDDRWFHLSPHDLRGSWATLMVHDYDVNPLLVMDWGGWESLETFMEVYRGIYSASAQRRELERVPWIAADVDETRDIRTEPRPIGKNRV